MSIEVTQGYCERSGNNTLVTVGNLRVYFSYSTPIAFRDYNEKAVCSFAIRKNEWSTTTGKHLNAIDSDKKIRIDSDKFEILYAEALKKNGLIPGDLN